MEASLSSVLVVLSFGQVVLFLFPMELCNIWLCTSCDVEAGWDVYPLSKKINCVRPYLPSEYAMNQALVIRRIAAIIACQLLPVKLQTIGEQVAGTTCIGVERDEGPAFLATCQDVCERRTQEPSETFGYDARPGTIS